MPLKVIALLEVKVIQLYFTVVKVLLSTAQLVHTARSSMPGLCQSSGCCMAPLLFRFERGGQGDDNQLSHEDQLDSCHIEKLQESRPVEEVSVCERGHVGHFGQMVEDTLTFNHVLKVPLLVFTLQVVWFILVFINAFFWEGQETPAVGLEHQCSGKILYSHCLCGLPCAILFAAREGGNPVGRVYFIFNKIAKNFGLFTGFIDKKKIIKHIQPYPREDRVFDTQKVIKDISVNICAD